MEEKNQNYNVISREKFELGSLEDEISEDMKHGLLTQVKENGRKEFVDIDGEVVKEIVGKIAEQLVRRWAEENKERILAPYIDDEKVVINNLGKRRFKYKEDQTQGSEADLVFEINQPSGKKLVFVEIKYGKGGIHHRQAQFYRHLYHRPGYIFDEVNNEIFDKVEEVRVMVIKCIKFNLEEAWIALYWGELQVPDKDPLEEAEGEDE